MTPFRGGTGHSGIDRSHDLRIGSSDTGAVMAIERRSVV